MPFPVARFFLGGAVACVIAMVSVSMQAQTEVVKYHDLSVMQTWPLGNMQVKGALGQSASFALAEMPPGARGRAGNAHHHLQEQIVIGLSGSSVMGISGVAYRLGSYGAAVTPRDTQHFSINGSTSGPSTFIEFQPVLRHDWFPPYPKVPPTAGSTPSVVSPEQRVFEDFDPSSSNWQEDASGARTKVLNGETITLKVLDLSAPKASTSLSSQPSRPEQFVYVLEGHAEVSVGASRREVGSGMLVVVSPAAQDVGLRSLNRGRTLIAVLSSSVR
jgi:uncharacterized cupin superfamily protein